MRYRHSSVILLTMTVLLFTSASQAMDPPVKMWEKWYYTDWDGCHFRDIELCESGEFFVTGNAYDWTNPIMDNYCAFKIDDTGNVIWKVIKPFYGILSYDGAIAQDGSFIITGTAVVEPSDTYSLFIMKISQEGSIEWTKIYDYPETKEEGYGITCLPDGGFAVCGRVHGTGSLGAGQAWLLRTDAYGDTLWTMEWGSTVENSRDWGKTVLFNDNNNELCVLAYGKTDSLPSYGIHLLFYDLDGNYLHGTNFGAFSYPADMCLASDGGYTFVTKNSAQIWHTDCNGEILCVNG